MGFSSPFFIFVFLPFTIAGYFLIDFCGPKSHSNIRFKNIWLLILSLFFYGWGEPKYIIIMIFSIIANYYLGLAIQRYETHDKFFLITAIVLDIGILVFYKYMNFIVENLNFIFNTNIQGNDIHLPIGISFYTFQVLSYILDVYRDKSLAQKKIINLALYISMFPQLVAGPIVRYSDIAAEITCRKSTKNDLQSGTVRFILGFAKKVIIADSLGVLADEIFTVLPSSSIEAWIGLIAFSLQIYYDFCGYSDMAIGLGLFFGFHFTENFDYPYTAQSVKEFWRRWHISLGAWFRDYVYIPLGGNRKGLVKTCFNTFVVFLLTGLWHGASWNFVIWGLFYALLIIAENLGFSKILNKLPEALRHFYVIFVVMLGWILFNTNTIQETGQYIRMLFSFSENSSTDIFSVLKPSYVIFMILGIFFSIPLMKKLQKTKMSTIKIILMFILFFAAICCMVGRGYSPFLYFRF